MIVAGGPVGIVWWLRFSHTISSPALGVLIGMTLSLGAAQLGRVVWEKHPGSEDLLFSELMIWGYAQRWRSRRRLRSARQLLEPMNDVQRRALEGLSTKRQVSLLEQLVAGMETKDPYLHGHSRRVARHAWMIARRMGLPREAAARIRAAAAIHDVGKTETPTSILHKRGPLSDREFEVIKRHPDDGARMAAVLGDVELAAIVRHHHERLDGTGYPAGLSGEAIPLGARIIAVADTFDAITSARPYRAASAHKKALDVLNEEAGTTLDPAVVAAFSSHYAGRRALALSAILGGLPERALSWLGGSVGGVASAAKVVALAAIVGGTAVTSSTLALPGAATHPTPVHRSSVTRGRAGRTLSAPAGAGTASSPRAVSHRRRAPVARRVTLRAPAAVGTSPKHAARLGALSVQPAASGGIQVNHGRPATAPSGEHRSAAAPGRSPAGPPMTPVRSGGGGEAPGKSGEAPGQKTAEQAPGKSGEAPGRDTPGETPGAREAPARPKAEEGAGNSGQAPVRNPSEQAPGKSGEAPGHNKAEQAPGKSGEAPGHNKP